MCNTKLNILFYAISEVVIKLRYRRIMARSTTYKVFESTVMKSENQLMLGLIMILVSLCVPINSQCYPGEFSEVCSGQIVTHREHPCTLNQQNNSSCNYKVPVGCYILANRTSNTSIDCLRETCCSDSFPISTQIAQLTAEFQLEMAFISANESIQSPEEKNLAFNLCSTMISAQRVMDGIKLFLRYCQLVNLMNGSGLATMNLIVWTTSEPPTLFSDTLKVLNSSSYLVALNAILMQLNCIINCNQTYSRPTTGITSQSSTTATSRFATKTGDMSSTTTESTTTTSSGLGTPTTSRFTTTSGSVPSSMTQSTSTNTNSAADDSSRVIGLAVGLSTGIFAVIVVVVIVVICVLVAMRRQKKHTPVIVVNSDDIRPAEHNVYGVKPSVPLDESGPYQTILLDRPGEVRELPNNSSSNQYQQLVHSDAENLDLTVVENSIYGQKPTFDGSTSVPASRNTHIRHTYHNHVTLIPGQPTTTQSNNVNVSSISTESEDCIPRPSAEGHHNNPPIRHQDSSPIYAIPQKRISNQSKTGGGMIGNFDETEDNIR